jgi:hypothetical protein
MRAREHFKVTMVPPSFSPGWGSTSGEPQVSHASKRPSEACDGRHAQPLVASDVDVGACAVAGVGD